jgi:regulator of protease activity HflC (stomatin/prohibitin superfamily)
VLEPSSAALKVVGWSFRKSKRNSRVVFQRQGIVWWWPATTELLVHPVARQANNLPTQTIETTDGKSYAIGCMIVYEISDLERLLVSAFDPDDTIKDIAATAAHSAASPYSVQELREAARSGKLEREMKSEAHASLKDYGVRVLKVQITDLAPCRVIRLMTSEPSDAGKLFTS